MTSSSFEEILEDEIDTVDDKVGLVVKDEFLIFVDRI